MSGTMVPRNTWRAMRAVGSASSTDGLHAQLHRAEEALGHRRQGRARALRLRDHCTQSVVSHEQRVLGGEGGYRLVPVLDESGHGVLVRPWRVRHDLLL